MDANMGSTYMSKPTFEALNTYCDKHVQNRIFLLTDGCANDKEETLKYIKDVCSKNENIKVFSFGISNECDK